MLFDAHTRILQRPTRFDLILKGRKPVDRTPLPTRNRMWYDRQKTFLRGVWRTSPVAHPADHLRMQPSSAG